MAASYGLLMKAQTMIIELLISNVTQARVNLMMLGIRPEAILRLSFDNPTGISEDSQQLLLNMPLVFGSLLLTPDEYLLGNIDKARALRLKAIEQLAVDPTQLRQSWADEANPETFGVMESFFKIHFKNWAKSILIPNHGPMAGDKGLELTMQAREKRQKRFETNLAERSESAFAPDWSGKFQDALATLQIPPFEIYAKAFKEQNGALHLSPRFAAQTLEQTRSFKEEHRVHE